jgi:hypothetical protein
VDITTEHTEKFCGKTAVNAFFAAAIFSWWRIDFSSFGGSETTTIPRRTLYIFVDGKFNAWTELYVGKGQP